VHMFDFIRGKALRFDGTNLSTINVPKFAHAKAEETPLAVVNGKLIGIFNGKHEANVRAIDLDTKEVGYIQDSRIGYKLIKGVGATSGSELMYDGVILWPTHNGLISFDPVLNLLSGLKVKSMEAISSEADYQGLSVATIEHTGATFKGYIVTEDVVSVLVSESIYRWLKQDTPNKLAVRSLSGTYLYNVAQRLPGGGGEGPIMATASDPIELDTEHVRIDTSDIVHTEPLRLYRTGGYLTRYSMVDDIDLPDSYIDKRDDVTIALGRKGSMDYNEAPPEELKYLTEHLGKLFGSVGNKLYFSEDGSPANWDRTKNFILLERDITGLASVGNGLVIFMASRMKLLMGTHKTNYSLRTITNNKGTTDPESIQPASGGALFFSASGLCYTDGATVTDISHAVLGQHQFDAIASASTDRYYYALIKNYLPTKHNKLLMRYDFGAATPAFSFLNGDDMEGIGVIDGRIYHSDGRDLYDTFNSGQREFHYKSGAISEGIPTMKKEWDKVRLYGEFEGKFNVYIDDRLVYNKDVSYPITPIHIPKAMNKGYTISFELKGVGSVHSIEYTITERKTTK